MYITFIYKSFRLVSHNFGMSLRNIIIRWYGINDLTCRQYVNTVAKLYTLMIKDITQWLANKHSIKKYVKLHFPKHFDKIYDHTTPSNRKESIQQLLISQISGIESDEKILGRLINLIDKIF